MSWKKILADYFTFSRKDRIGIITLICLVLLMILIPYYYGQPNNSSPLKTDSTLLKAIKPAADNIIYTSTSFAEGSANNSYQARQALKEVYNANATPFPFDPNTLDEEGWKNLGLPSRSIRTILNYRSKGGRFYKKEDIKKIWGLPEGFYDHVENYIHIPAKEYPSHFNFTEKKTQTTKSIDINTADTTAFIALPGIGSKLANRIISFRDKLGGFYSIDQISETYGLPDSTFQKLKNYFQISETQLRIININKATKDDLKTHPYIRWNLANAIIEYRNQHGSFTSIEDLKKITLIDEETFNKIQPYLTL